MVVLLIKHYRRRTTQYRVKNCTSCGQAGGTGPVAGQRTCNAWLPLEQPAPLTFILPGYYCGLRMPTRTHYLGRNELWRPAITAVLACNRTVDLCRTVEPNLLPS